MNKKRRFRAPKGYLYSRSKLNQEKDINSSKRQRIQSRLGCQIVNKQGHVVCVSHTKTLNDRHRTGGGGVYPPIGLTDK